MLTTNPSRLITLRRSEWSVIWSKRLADAYRVRGELTREKTGCLYEWGEIFRLARQHIADARRSARTCFVSEQQAQLRKRRQDARQGVREVGTGVPWMRQIAHKTPIKRWNGYGFQTVGWRADLREYVEAKKKYEMRKRRPSPSHVEYIICPACEGEGLGGWRENRRSLVQPMYRALCKRCGGAGRIAKRVRGAGEDEILDWDGTLAATWLATGRIDRAEYDRIREICRIRHETTNYDELLAMGYSKEDARSDAE